MADMTPDRAALVEKVATLITRGCPVAHQCDGSGCHEWEAEQAIDLIRADVLEEAARVADATTAFDDNVQKSAGCWTTGQRIAAAIRALKDKQHD